MSTYPGGGPAFPVQTIFSPNGEAIHTGQYWDGNGMTLRDYFASAALNGLLSAKHGDVRSAECVARDAYEYAAAMVAERAKPISSNPAPTENAAP